MEAYQLDALGAALSPGAGAVNLCGAGLVAQAETATTRAIAESALISFISCLRLLMSTSA